MNYVHLRNVSILSTFIDSCTAAEKSRLDKWGLTLQVNSTGRVSMDLL